MNMEEREGEYGRERGEYRRKRERESVRNAQGEVGRREQNDPVASEERKTLAPPIREINYKDKREIIRHRDQTGFQIIFSSFSMIICAIRTT